MDKEVLAIFSLVVVVALVGLIIHEAFPQDANDITGLGFRKKFKKALRKVEKEVSRTSDRVETEAKRFESRVGAEADRFGRRTSAEWQRFDERVGNELERYSERVEAEINRVDDNIKKLGDKAEEEYKRFINRIKNDVDAQSGAFKNLAKGRVCDAYNSAQKSDVVDVNGFIYNTLVPPIKGILQPHVAMIVRTTLAQIGPAINSIPIFGNALYGMVVAYAEGRGIDQLSERAAKKVIREALEECN